MVLFLANNEASMNYPSNTYRYRQDSSFTYFYGLQIAGLVGVIDIDEDKEILFGDDYGIDDIIWMGNQPTIKELATSIGVDNTQAFSELEGYIRKVQQQNRKIHFLPPYRDDSRIFLSRLLQLPIESLKDAASVELIKAVVALRSIKTDEEIEEWKKYAMLV